MQVFYSPNFNDKIINLSKEESLHCIKVLRKKISSIVYITNGNGKFVRGKIIDDNLNNVTIEVLELIKDSSSTDFNLHIAISPLKNPSRLEWFIEKAVEMRVSKITPIICSRTEKQNVKIDRLIKISLEAMKQSHYEFLPIIDNPIKINDFLINTNAKNKYIATCTNNNNKVSIDKINHDEAIIIIGPEGDFSDDEIQLALNNNFQELSLGDSRLRTETAAMFCVASFYMSNINK